MDAHILLPDAQKGADLGLDAAVDLSSGRWANENEVFHRIPPSEAHFPHHRVVGMTTMQLRAMQNSRQCE